jgi:hypothetical protein
LLASFDTQGAITLLPSRLSGHHIAAAIQAHNHKFIGSQAFQVLAILYVAVSANHLHHSTNVLNATFFINSFQLTLAHIHIHHHRGNQAVSAAVQAIFHHSLISLAHQVCQDCHKYGVISHSVDFQNLASTCANSSSDTQNSFKVFLSKKSIGFHTNVCHTSLAHCKNDAIGVRNVCKSDDCCSCCITGLSFNPLTYSSSSLLQLR